MRIVKAETAFVIPKRKAEKDKDYLAFIHELPCVLSGRLGVEACHVSFANKAFGHFGRGKGAKASDRWVVPMQKAYHERQHARGDEEAFWREVGLNPHLLCLIIYGLFNEAGMDAVPEATKIIRAGEFRWIS